MVAAGPGGTPMPGGYTIVVRSGGFELAGPYLITPNQIRQPAEIHWTARINGSECAQGDVAVALGLENTSLRPGEFRTTPVLGSAALRSGDVFEVEAERLGVLRARVS